MNTKLFFQTFVSGITILISVIVFNTFYMYRILNRIEDGEYILGSSLFCMSLGFIGLLVSLMNRKVVRRRDWLLVVGVFFVYLSNMMMYKDDIDDPEVSVKQYKNKKVILLTDGTVSHMMHPNNVIMLIGWVLTIGVMSMSITDVFQKYMLLLVIVPMVLSTIVIHRFRHIVIIDNPTQSAYLFYMFGWILLAYFNSIRTDLVFE